MTQRRRRRPPYQRADLSFDIGRRTRLVVRLRLTSGGLVAVAALVSATLLSTAALVRIAIREGKRRSSG
jgi:hypothetical protein